MSAWTEYLLISAVLYLKKNTKTFFSKMVLKILNKFCELIITHNSDMAGIYRTAQTVEKFQNYLLFNTSAKVRTDILVYVCEYIRKRIFVLVEHWFYYILEFI